MKTKTLLPAIVLLLVLLSQSFCAQTAFSEPAYLKTAEDTLLKNRYERETIYLNGSTNSYTKNKVRKKIGFFGKKIKKEFESCTPETRSEMDACSKKKKRGTILVVSGGILLIGSLFLMPVAVGPVILSAAVIGLVPYIIGALDLNNAQNHLNKAIWFHNRDVVSKR